jgi:feruloyl esterase
MLIFRLYVTANLVLRAGGSRTVTETESFNIKCRGFRPDIDNTNFEFTELVKKGNSAPLMHRDYTCGGPGSSSPVYQDVCRVALKIKTSDRSGVQFEAWLPKEWNGRFLSTGNGGIGGCQ